MTTIAAAGVAVGYNGVLVVHDLDVDVPAGTWLGLIGPNGAGKSTLLRAIAGLLPYGAGEIHLDGTPVASLPRRRVSQLVAFVPQRPVLPDGMAVTDYVLLGRTPYIAYLGSESRHDLTVVAGVLDRLELADLADRPLQSLSGGEAQRAVLARALAQDAPVLLLDEPTATLDVGHQQQVLELIDELRRERDLTVVTALHDLTLAGQFADRLVLMAGGRVVADGPAPRVLTERTIRDHYGALVRILHDPDGGVFVIPTRTQASSEVVRQ
ncbi:MAG: ABC transporter ATP-binding protein [Acidimicrobiales bacterium]